MELKEKPLHRLIKNLIEVSNNDSFTTVENSQLLEILREDFNLDDKIISELDIDIYMNVLKRFLRNWPRWDEFDKLMKENSGNSKVIQSLTFKEYTHLKSYLKGILDYTTTQMKPIIDKIENKRAKSKEERETSIGDTVTVLEVCCTRNQLNKLIYSKPHPVTYSIFNVTDDSACIPFRDIKFQQLLNWPNVTVFVELPNFRINRHNCGHIERFIINRKAQKDVTISPLPRKLYANNLLNMSKNKLQVHKNIVISYLVQLINHVHRLPNLSGEHRDQLICLFNEIKIDILLLSDEIFENLNYKFFLCDYPYQRQLHTDHNFGDSSGQMYPKNIKPDNFDMRLLEIISPAIELSLHNFSVDYREDKSGRIFTFDYPCFTDVKSNWLRFECTLCSYTCTGFLGSYHIMGHMNKCHEVEPDWTCSKCETTLSMLDLCSRRWSHNCQVDS